MPGGEAVEHTEDLFAICSAVDPELVLDYRYVKIIKRRCGPRLCGDRPRIELTYDIRSDDGFWLVDNTNDSGSAASRNKLGSKRRGERGEAALCRGVGTRESNRQGHEDNFLARRGPHERPRRPRRPTARGSRRAVARRSETTQMSRCVRDPGPVARPDAVATVPSL